MTEAEAQTAAPMEMARRFVEQIPAPSSMFTSIIRAVKNAEQALRNGDPAALKELTLSSSHFLLGVSPTLKAICYRAAQDLHAVELAALKPLTMKGLLNLFTPHEILAILSLTYLYRHLKRRLPQDAYARLMKKVLTHSEIGSMVGRTIKYIGVGNGLLLGMRFFSHALFMLADEKKFTEYRRKVDRADKLFDPDSERAIFGCTSLEVASQLLRVFGYGLVPASGFALAERGETPADFSEQMAEEVLYYRVAIALTEAFHLTGAAPVVGEDSELYLPPEESAALQKQCWSVVRDGSHFTWLTSSRSELSPEIRTALEIPTKGSGKSGIEDLEEGEESGT